MATFTSTRSLPKQVPAFPRNNAVLRDVLARIREAYPDVQGLTHVTADAAIFQVHGDPIRYCLKITRAEADALGFLEL